MPFYLKKAGYLVKHNVIVIKDKNWLCTVLT